jgi:hypothetical protein
VTEEADRPTLEERARRANEKHHAAEANMTEGIRCAVQAGEELNKAKKEVRRGSWGRWIEENLQFSHAKANLYMRMAKVWPTLPESKRVRIMTIRQAARMVYGADKDANPDKLRQEVRRVLKRVGIGPKELRGLPPKQRQVLGDEVLMLYRDLCDEACLDPDRPRGAPEPVLLLDWKAVRWFTRETIKALRNGAIGHKTIRRKLRPLEFMERVEMATPTEADGEDDVDDANEAEQIIPVISITSAADRAADMRVAQG